MKLTLNFTELGRNDAMIAGGKGASLGEMTQAGIPVPPGFVVLSTTFDEFIKEADLVQEIDAIIDSVNHKDINSVEVASEKIQALIKNAQMPERIASEIKAKFKVLDTEFVAVRSSATAEDGADNAWAGQLDSFLNTKEANLLEKVQHCWASLFTPRAIFYRFEKGLHTTKISVAVVVQKMVNSEVSGIAFSVHPVTEDRNQMIIEAGFGLGEAIVSGSVTPDSYVIEKEPRRIIDVNVSSQTRALYRVETGGNEWIDISEPKASSQVLTEVQISEFADLIMRIENHYGFPCDIEWAFEKGKFYIVQSRPITTLGRLVNTDIKLNIENIVIKFEDYQQLFSTKSMSLLMADIFSQYYRKFDGLVTYSNDTWTSFLNKKVIEQTMIDGVALYNNKSNFDKFKKEIQEYYIKSADIFEKILAKNELTEALCREYIETISENWKHYSKTEFFYTDGAFNYGVNNPVIKNNLEQLELLKNESRLKMNKIAFQPDSYRRLLVSKLIEKFNITKDEISSYTVDDIYKLFHGIRLDSKSIKEREKSYLILCKEGHVEYFFGDKAQKIIDNFLVQSKTDSTLIKGVIANKGYVKGRVTVIEFGHEMFKRLPEVINQMPEGNILLADTTGPELITACKKASAIITNQGGMMSHAAIVSRELNIPCIVGLGHATQAIKDGDMVEVDADNGVVKIIK